MSESRILDYQLIQADNPDSLTQKVKALIGLDWQPLGAAFNSNAEANGRFIEPRLSQTMVRYDSMKRGE